MDNIKTKYGSINIEDISIFETKCDRYRNDNNNKIREIIIYSIYNDLIPNVWYTKLKWLNLKEELNKLIEHFSPNEKYFTICEYKAGRNYNYDFLLIYKSVSDNTILKELKLEWKSNAEKINDCPQWVSPMYPSKYMSSSYEDYFYDNYLSKIFSIYNENLISKDEYIKNIHNPKPLCMINIQTKYYMGCKSSSKYSNNIEDTIRYNKCKKISSESINNFINENSLNVDLLNKYLEKSQKDKIYMLWKNNKINFYKHNINDYTIDKNSIKKTKNSFIGKTLSAKPIKILLRWKNGNGIAYPAFQIK